MCDPEEKFSLTEKELNEFLDNNFLDCKGYLTSIWLSLGLDIFKDLNLYSSEGSISFDKDLCLKFSKLFYELSKFYKKEEI